MIEEWTLGNFKSVAEPITLEFAPLTLLVGPNSSGKSTLLQSILMTAQTLKSPTGHRHLVLNGELARLGFPNDILHVGNEHQPLQLGFVLSPSPLQSRRDDSAPIRVNIECVPDSSANKGFAEFRLRVVDLMQGSETQITAHLVHPNRRTMTNLSVHRTWIVERMLRPQIESGLFDYAVDRFSTKDRFSRREQMHISVQHFLPGKLLEPYDQVEETILVGLEQAAELLAARQSPSALDALESIEFRSKHGRELHNQLIRALDRVTSRVHGEATIQHIGTAQRLLSRSRTLMEWVQYARQELPTPNRRIIAKEFRYIAASQGKKLHSPSLDAQGLGLRTTDLPNDILSAVTQVVELFAQHLRYLGPLRDDPRAVYGFPSNPESRDVGLKGEFTASVLEQCKEIEVEYPVPPTTDAEFGLTKQGSLLQAVTDWLRHMRLVEEIDIYNRGKIGYELTVHSPEVSRNLDLTNVGVGVSQVLPTLVMALLAPKDSVLLFEQPELHLHPRIQSILGDFFLGLVKLGSQCIVETHSEYIVNRIRRRIAEAEGSTLRDLTCNYFVENVNGASRFLRVQPNEYGAISDWPKGFFDEGPGEAQLIIQAAMAKRNKARDTKTSQAKGR